MALIKTEPVATSSSAAGAFMLVVAYLVSMAFPDMPVAIQGAVATLIAGPVIAFVIAVARRHSFAENTLREAGLDPAAVERNANNPLIDRCTVGEETPPEDPPERRRRKPRPT